MRKVGPVTGPVKFTVALKFEELQSKFVEYQTNNNHNNYNSNNKILHEFNELQVNEL